MLGVMLLDPLVQHARQTPDDVAVIDDRGQYTFQQLASMSAGMGMLLSFKTRKPNVGILLPSSAGFVASFFGTLLAGKTAVLINFLLGDREVQHCIADSGIDTVLTIPQLAPRVQNLGLNVIDLTALPQNSPVPPPQSAPARSADDLAVLMYTSGTSGLPKGVMLTHGNIRSDVDSAIAHVKMDRSHKFLGVIPLFHAFGMTAMMVAPISLGAKVIYTSRFSPVGALKAIREHQVSLMFGVPSMFGAMLRLKDAGPEDFRSIYALVSGGEPLPSNIRDGFAQRFHVPLLEGYGLTETSAVASFNTPMASRPGSVGKPIPGVEVQITDEHGAPVEPGTQGEIWLRGPMIMKGYYNLPNETGSALTPERFFKTGDLGHLDADGFLHITGRKKDLIIVAGEKAAPREIEEVLLKHPSLAEAAVVGKKDPSRGEVVVAFVILKEGQTASADAIRDFCRQQGLAQWKCPREVIIVDDLPRSPTGKVLKRVLAEQASQSVM